MTADTVITPRVRQRTYLLKTIADVCDQLPGKRSRRIHRSTVTRWIIVGCPARDGTRIRLNATRCGSRWLVDSADLDAFFAALAAVPSSPSAALPATPTPVRTDSGRRTAASRAAEELARRGA